MQVNGWRLLRAYLLTVYGIALALALPPAALLAGYAETPGGRAVAWACLALAAWPAALVARSARASAARTLFAAGLPIAVLALGLLASMLSPRGRTVPDAALQVGWLGSGGYARWSPFSLVPELDQVKLGAVLAPDLFARIDRSKTQRILSVTMPIYRSLQADPDYAAAGSAMHLAFRDVFTRGDDAGHFLKWRKPRPERSPVLLFLHGSGGNFASYTRFWQRWCEPQGWAVVCPTYGFGDWSRDEAQKSLDRLLAALDRDPGLDMSRVILAGLSNGARGATMLASRLPGRFRALALFSPALDTEILEGSTFLQGWKGRHVLVMYGDQDEVIPWQYVESAANRMARDGVATLPIKLPGEDHFMLFSAPQAVFMAMDGLRNYSR